MYLNLKNKFSLVNPPAQNFFIFMQFLGKKWPNNRLMTPSRVGAPSGKSWIRNWSLTQDGLNSCPDRHH